MIVAIGSPGEIQAVALRDGVVVDLAIERSGAPDRVGAVFGAVLTERVPSMAGAFLDLGQGLTGFLPDSEGAKHRSAGERMLVRVTRAAQGGKGPRVSARGVPEGGSLPGLIASGPGAVARLAALHPGVPIVVDDRALLAALPAALRDRASLGEAPGNVLDRLAALRDPHAALPGGARATITPTAALTAIDVDASAATGASHEAINRAVLPALAAEIRLRNLSGGIVIDLAGMAARARGKLGPALEAALARDPLGPKFLGFSALGFAEIVRARVHPPLHELIRGPYAALVEALRAAVAAPRMGTLLAAPALLAAADPAMLADVARRRPPLALRSAPELEPQGWRLAH